MASPEEPSQQALRWIADVLHRHWDPIGVRDEPRAQAEHAAYVAGVYRLIVSGATPRQLAEHLVRIETERLGFQDTDPKMLVPVAKKLLKLNVRLDSEGGAV